MYDILILSHGHLAEGFYRTMEMIFGEEPKIRWASLMEGESPEEFGKKLEERVDWESTCGLLVLCDLFGGSPCMGAVSRHQSSHDNGSLFQAGRRFGYKRRCPFEGRVQQYRRCKRPPGPGKL